MEFSLMLSEDLNYLKSFCIEMFLLAALTEDNIRVCCCRRIWDHGRAVGDDNVVPTRNP